MYISGMAKSEIAAALGVSKATVSIWSRKDNWDSKLAKVVERAAQAAELATEDALAAVIADLRGKLAQRVRELERLCSVAETPATRLSAIRLWFQLADVKTVLPNPVRPESAGSLELIQDLADPKGQLIRQPRVRLDTEPPADANGGALE